MATSEVDICNMALGFLGATLIMSREESQPCETNYETTRDSCLEDYNWSFATKRVVLSSQHLSEPVFGYTKRFLLPTDTIRVVEVNGNTIDWVKEGRFILTDQESLEIIYISRVEDVRQMSPSFVQALATRLASVIAIPITNSGENAKAYWTMYQNLLHTAASNDSRQGRSLKIRRNVSLRRNSL
jgi:hypothetical protein